MDRIEIIHNLPSGPVPVDILICECSSAEVPINAKRTREACKTCGAFGRNWGCPPFAPRFGGVSRDKMILICARVLTESYPQKVLGGHFGVKMLFSETFLKPLTDKFGLALAEAERGMFLSSGNCRSCRKCARKDGLPCRDSGRRTFSLEATGVLVTQLVEEQFGFPLQWWSRETTPEYMCKVVAVTV